MPFNVVEILKVGLSGLVFLFAFLAYRLLSREQKKDKPSKESFKNIVIFNVFMFLSALMVAIFSWLPLLSSHEKLEVTCRDSFSRLTTASKLPDASADDLRAAIQTHAGKCHELLEEGGK